VREPCIGIRMTLDDIDIDEHAREHKNLSELASSVRNAMRSALQRASPCLLEPVQILRFELPQESIGDISKLVASKRGDIVEMQQHEGRMVVDAKFAVAEMIGLSSDIRSSTEGKVSFSVVRQLFEPVPQDIQESVLLSIKRRKGFFVAGT